MTGLRRLPCLAASGLLAAVAAPADAAENGIGFYLLGSRTTTAGYIPPPGLYLQNDVYYYNGSLGGNKQLPSGGNILAEVKGRVGADFLTATWVLPADVLGGNVALGVLMPFGQPRVSADIVVNSSGTGLVGRRPTDTAFIVGDPVAIMALGWHSGQWHWNITGLLNIPVGNYRDGQGEFANLAFHRIAGDISGAVTWLDPESGWEVSAAAGITLNGTNPATDYTTGTEFHAEWAVSKALTKQFSLGVIGYYYDQITRDTGPGAKIGPFEGRVTAVGGTAAYNFEIDGTPISTRIKVYREFNAVNRLQGTSAYLTVSLPLVVTK